MSVDIKKSAPVAKTTEADEDIGTTRLVAHARKEIAAGAPLIPKQVVDKIISKKKSIRLPITARRGIPPK